VAAPKGARKAPLPATLAPQLATLVDAPPAHPDLWSFEMKLDGYRILARCSRSGVRLYSRNAKDWTDRLPAVRDALEKLKLGDAWLDGEIVVLRESGVPSFQLLQNAFDQGNTARILYYVFDLPFHGGYDLRVLPLEARRAVLAPLLRKAKGAVRYSEEFDAPVADLLESACRLQLEGLIGKRRDSLYSSGRSKSWIKLKCKTRQEFVIGGYTDPQGSRTGFGALLLGVHADGGLRYSGRVGTGFDDKRLADLHRRMKTLETSATPFANPPRGADARGVHWVKPTLVGEVEFAEWTDEGVVRHATFRGLREDKPAKSIRRERAQ
jgi:bifunctional non-homologous end joining protein LigD